MPLNMRAKQALESAGEEATALGHPMVGTEHVLLGLLADPEAMAAELVAKFGVTAAELRADVLGSLSGEGPAAES
jgi:ATP-dependent Clp protease ATP-binding subunit ClpC